MRALRLLALSLTFGVALSQSRAGAADDDALRQHIENLISTVTDATQPGVALLVKKDGSTYIKKGYGVREFGKPARIDPATNFTTRQRHQAVHGHGHHAPGARRNAPL